MIPEIIARWEANKKQLETKFSEAHPKNYKELVTLVVETVTTGDYGDLDSTRISEINDGDYQGTLLYLIPEETYQPQNYWFVRIAYGSCSGCDMLESITEYSTDLPSEDQIKNYMTLSLHIVQQIKKLPEYQYETIEIDN